MDAATPAAPKLVKSTNPKVEQLAHPPAAIPTIEPKNDDLFIFTFVFFRTYRFMLRTIPISAEITFDSIKTGIASDGR
ncbi:MAG: hypothetical protein MAG458_01432 [Nitrosopumilus sp.]|nr:hypothetical protein [Nitrosopumilus sp.]